MVTSMSRGNTLSRCAATSTVGPRPPGTVATTLPTPSRSGARPASRHMPVSRSARFSSSKVGAGVCASRTTKSVRRSRMLLSSWSAWSITTGGRPLASRIAALQRRDALPERVERGLGPVVEAELREDLGEAVPHGLLTHPEAPGDLLVGGALRQVPEDLLFALG